MDVFTNFDGDYHVHVLVDKEYRGLLKSDFIFFPYAEILRLMSTIPIAIIIAYLAVSMLRPARTTFGRFLFKRRKANEP